MIKTIYSKIFPLLTFPNQDLDILEKNALTRKFISTICFGINRNKFRKNDIVTVPWGGLWKITKFRPILFPDEHNHPLYKSETYKKLGPYDIIELSPINSLIWFKYETNITYDSIIRNYISVGLLYSDNIYYCNGFFDRYIIDIVSGIDKLSENVLFVYIPFHINDLMMNWHNGLDQIKFVLNITKCYHVSNISSVEQLYNFFNKG